MSPLILFAFVLTFPTRPTTAWKCGGCKDVFDNFSACADFIQGQCNDPSPLCCHNIKNLNAMAGQEGPTRMCKCIEYFATYKADHPFNASRIQEVTLKCDTRLSFPISEHMDCSSISGDDEESYMGRRILAESGHISYGALKRDNVPCSRRGKSYYNCHSKEQANPYSRGCTRISHCQRNNR